MALGAVLRFAHYAYTLDPSLDQSAQTFRLISRFVMLSLESLEAKGIKQTFWVCQGIGKEQIATARFQFLKTPRKKVGPGSHVKQRNCCLLIAL